MCYDTEEDVVEAAEEERGGERGGGNGGRGWGGEGGGREEGWGGWRRVTGAGRRGGRRGRGDWAVCSFSEVAGHRVVPKLLYIFFGANYTVSLK